MIDIVIFITCMCYIALPLFSIIKLSRLDDKIDMLIEDFISSQIIKEYQVDTPATEVKYGDEEIFDSEGNSMGIVIVCTTKEL